MASRDKMRLEREGEKTHELTTSSGYNTCVTFVTYVHQNFVAHVGVL